MLKGLKVKLDDMATIRRLCEAAEAHALRDQQREPGAEHFLLAALDLSDGTARLAFQRVGADPDALPAAIEQQYADALGAIGLAADALPDSAPPPPTRLYHAATSGQQIMQELAESREDRGPLLGTHVVGVVAGLSQGVAARALRALGVDPVTLESAADEIARSRRPH